MIWADPQPAHHLRAMQQVHAKGNYHSNLNFRNLQNTEINGTGESAGRRMEMIASWNRTFHRTFRSAAVPGRLVLLHSELNCKTLAAE